MHRRRVASSAVVLGVALLIISWLLIPHSSQGGAFSNWLGYLFVPRHSSYNPTARAITVANAPDLIQAWTWEPDPGEPGQPGPSLIASPTVAGGRIYIGANTGDFYALDEATGTVVWKRFLGFVPQLTCNAARGFSSTATVDRDPVTGELTVYLTAADGYLYALDADDGSTTWRAEVAIPSPTANDYYNWSSPAVLGGRVYVGVSSQCNNPSVRGGAKAFDQATGALLGTFWSVNAGTVGGSVWSSPAATRRHVFLTTGNPRVDDGESIVRLDAATMTKQEAWQLPADEERRDSDFGSSPTLFLADVGGRTTQMVGACNKNGKYYALRSQNLGAGYVWSFLMGSSFGEGGGICIGGTIWDGSHLYVGGPRTTIDGTEYEGSIRKLNPNTGIPVWETGLPGTVLGTPTKNGAGVVAAATYDDTNAVYLIDASNGKILTTLDTENAQVFSQPVFADDYLFVATTFGTMFAYTPGP